MSAEAEKNKADLIGKRGDEKWTKELMAAGYTMIPNVLLDGQQRLGLDALDLAIIVHLAKHWWDADRPPFPSKKSLALCLDVSPRTVQRRITKLERAGCIKRRARYSKREKRQQSNEYSLAGLIEKAKPIAEEFVAAKAKRQADEDDRRKRSGRRRTAVQS